MSARKVDTAIDDTPKKGRRLPATNGNAPHRLLSKEGAAHYLNSSVDVVDKLIYTGQLPVVRLPVSFSKDRSENTSRRIQIDVKDLDVVIDKSKETLR